MGEAGKTRAGWVDDGCFVLWEGEPYRRGRRISTDRRWGSFVHFSPDGKTLVASKNDHALGLWEVASGKLYAEIPGESTWDGSSAFFPDAKKLIVGGSHGCALVWDLQDLKSATPGSRENARRVDGGDDRLPTGAVARLGVTNVHYDTDWAGPAFSPDSKTLAVGAKTTEDQSVRIWNVATRKEIRRFGMEGYWLDHLAYSRDGKLLVAATSDIVYLWNPETGAKHYQFRGGPEGVGCLAFSPDGKTLVVGAGENGNKMDRSILFWDLTSGRVVRRIDAVPGPVKTLAFSTDGKRLISYCSLRKYLGETGGWSPLPGGIFIWDVESGNLVRKLKASGDEAHISPNGKIVAIKEVRDKISVWDVETDKLLFQREGENI